MKKLCFSTFIFIIIILSNNNCFSQGRLYARYPNSNNSPIFNLRIKTLTVDVTIQDQFTVTHVDQEFANDNYAQLEGFYVFQLPEGANVNEMALWINGVRTPYTIKRREEATVIYQDIVKKLTDPAILEQLGKNLFKLRIFPIQSRSSRRIEIKYFQPLPRINGNIKYTFPLKMSDYTSSPIEKFLMKIDLKSKFKIKKLETSVDNEPISNLITQTSDYEFQIVYGGENTMYNKDYFLQYQIEKNDIALDALTYVSSGPFKEDPYFILWASAPDSLAGISINKREITFVADVSSSMEGKRITQLKTALNSFIDLLKPEDKFNIVTFGTNVIQFQPDILLATKDVKDQAKIFIDRLSAIGLTNFEAALNTSITQSYTNSIKSRIVFLTDGEPTYGIINPDSILSIISRKNTKNVPIFPVSIGLDTQSVLLGRIAQATNGFLTVIKSEDSISSAITNLLKKLFSPVLSSIQINYGDLNPYEIYQNLPSIMYPGDQAIQTGRFSKGGIYDIEFSGITQTSIYQKTNSVLFPDNSKSLPAIEQYWGAQKIQKILNTIKQYGEIRELVEQVISLSIRYSILTPYTAFLVIEPGTGTQNDVKENKNEYMQFELSNNYPNPFNPTTTIQYTIGGSKNDNEKLVRIVIFNIYGEEIKTLVSAFQKPGVYKIVWDGTDKNNRKVASGTYIYRLVSGNHVFSKTMILLK